MSAQNFQLGMHILRRRKAEVDNRYHHLSDLNINGDKVTTLSRSGVNSRGVIGNLYVPLLTENSSCYNQSREILPRRIVRRGDLGRAEGFPLFMAIAPWISAECTLEYLDVAKYLDDDLRAMIFYMPSDSTDPPPLANSSEWDLNDGGNWKKKHDFPVYAVPGATGGAVMEKLSEFANLTDSEAGRTILQNYPNVASNAFEIYGTVGTEREAGNPSLWLFLLIVIASLGGGLIITSIFMHWRARVRRDRLRRMIVNGEISLDLLGVKKVTVPQDDIDKMPLYIYFSGAPASDPATAEPHGSPPAVVDTASATTNHDAIPQKPAPTATTAAIGVTPQASTIAETEESEQIVRNPSNKPILPRVYENEAQPSCPICLDDYISGKTIVRSLGCSHIYHPECIDKFLSRNSSLCPMCKTSALPAGYCPPLITSTMVRRERDIRLRAELHQMERTPEVFFRNVRLWWLRKRARRNNQSLRSGSLELAMRRAMVRESVQRRNERRESMRQMTRSQRAEVRGRELAGENDVAGEHAEERPRPAWRRILRKLFPASG